MAEAARAPLVCPACRRREAGRLVVFPLEAGPLGLSCPGCGRDHPVVDGIPIVLADLDAWLASEGAAVMRRDDLDPTLRRRLCRGAGGVLARDEDRLDAYRGSEDGPLGRWASALASAAAGPVLELGCGASGVHAEHVLGLDLHWASLRLRPGTAVLADALNPPFLSDSFELVLALNLLDSCRDPGVMVQQALALVRPGGRLALASPFHWQESITPRAGWLSIAQVDGFLRSQCVDVDQGEQEWSLRLSPRSELRHRCVTWIARRSH